MKKYTQEEFDRFPVDERGRKQCPSGDYTLIQKFPERCSFGRDCSFGEWCPFGRGCSFGECCSFGEWCKCEFGEFKEIYTAGGFDSVGRTTYFFHMADGGVCVRCGCFSGDIDEWEHRVKKTHGNGILAESYLLIGKAVRAICGKLEEE